MRRSTVTIAVCIAILISPVLFGAGQQGGGEATPEVKVNPAGTFPIVDQPITITVFAGQDVRVVDYNDNYQTQMMEEKTNINIEWLLVPDQQVDDKINLILASGTDLPDVFARELGNDLVLKYGQEGIFIPVNDLIEKYGVNTKRIISDYEEQGVDFVAMYTMPDGNIYGLPRVNVCKWCETIWRCWVRKDWMEKLGLEMPATVDEFYDMLVAFRDQDPNGNGESDEIALMGARQGWGTQVEGFLMMPFIAYNAGNGNRMIYDEKTGKVSAAYTQPEWFEGVKYVKRLIDDELLDPVSLTQGREEYKVMGETRPAITGAHLASNFQFLTVKDKKYEEYEAIPALKSVDTGERQTFGNKYQPFGGSRWTITNEADYPEAIFRLGDYCYSEEVSMTMRYAKKGEDWVEVGPESGLRGPFGAPAKFKEIGQWGEPTKNSLRTSNLPFYLSWDLLKGLGMADNSDSYYVLRTPKYNDYKVANSLPRITMLPVEVDEYSELSSTLDTYVDETFARFVTGDLPLDAWDDFQAELEKIGIDRYIELLETAIERQYGD